MLTNGTLLYVKCYQISSGYWVKGWNKYKYYMKNWNKLCLTLSTKMIKTKT